MIDEDEAYAEWLSELIISYFASQLQSGRSVIYESEIWQLLGQELPEGQENRQFKLKEYVGDPRLELDNTNVVDFTKYKKRLH
jgi:hypothetical protein